MTQTIKIMFFAVSILLLITAVGASTFTYSVGGSSYIASLAGGGVINPTLSFNLTNGYLVPDNPNATYTVYAPVTTYNTQGWESPGGGEITILYDTTPVVLVGNSSVFKKWYQASSSPQKMGYAESTDGITWFKYASNPIVSGYFGGSVVKYSGTYYMFASSDGSHVTRLHSSDGVTSWVNDGYVAAYTGSWVTVGNLWYQGVWMDSPGNWKMLVSGHNNTNVWAIGLWESSAPDAASWTANANNPVIQVPASGNGTGLVYLPSGMYKDPLGYTWCWVSAANSPSAAASNTDTMRYRTTNPNDLTSWSQNPTMYINVGPTRGVSDPTDWQGRAPQQYVRVGNYTYDFYTYNTNGHPGYDGLLKTQLRIDQIVATNEMFPNLTYQQMGA